MKIFLSILLLSLIYCNIYSQTREQFISKADSLIKNDDFQNAELVLKDIIHLDPQFPDNYKYLTKLGACQRKIKKIKQALKSYKRSLKLNDRFVKTYFERADLYVQLDMLKKARKDYEKILEIEPRNETALTGYADVAHGITESTVRTTVGKERKGTFWTILRYASFILPMFQPPTISFAP